jgi:hypothetical protein
VNTTAFRAESPTGGTAAEARLVWLVPAVLTLAALALWVRALSGIELRDMNDLGLISVIPASMLAAFALLVVSFCLCLRMQPLSELALLGHVLALIFMIYGLPSFVEDVPRLAAAWRHTGVIEYIGRTGQLDPTIDAYFNWPGFFTLGAFLADLAGVDSTLGIARWAPILFNLLFLGPLLVIFRTATRDKRVVWLAIWFFYLMNWVSQDYFAPQAFGFFLYLVVIAGLLRFVPRDDEPAQAHSPLPTRARTPLPILSWLPSESRRPPEGDRPGTGNQPQASASGTSLAWRTRAWMASNRDAAYADITLSPAQRTGLVAAIIVLIAAIVSSHQLTPFAVLAGLASLTVLRRSFVGGLPLLTAVLIGGWMTFMAASYLAGNFGELLSQVGRLGTILEENVGDRTGGGSREHLFVVYLRLLATGALWAIALAGGVRAFRRGERYWPYALLAIAPFPLMSLQPYGGEMLLRVFLFSLPFMTFFAALAFIPTLRESRSPVVMIGLAAISLVFVFSLLVNRYGNERMEYFTSQEARAAERLYEIAKPGSWFVAATRNFPRNFQDYEKFEFEWLIERPDWKRLDPNNPDTAAIVKTLERSMARRGQQDSYIIVTRSQKAEVSLMGGAPAGSLDRFERGLIASPRFKLVYTNRDARIFAFMGNGS